MNAALDVLIKKIRPQMLSLGEIKMYPEHLLITNIGFVNEPRPSVIVLNGHDL